MEEITEETAKEKKKKSKKPLIIILIVVLVLAGGGIGAYLYFTPKEVNLNDYVSVNFSGYDGIGKAEVVYDIEKMKADLGKTDDENMAKVAESSGAKLDKTENLRNGDTINLSYFYDGKIAYDSRIQFVCADGPVTVEGLEETEKLDPFKDLKFKYSGVGPYATVKMKNKSKNEIVKNLMISFTPRSGLSSGDTIKVKVVDYDEKDFIAKNKAELTSTESEVTVPRLNQYVTRLDQISDKDLKELDDITFRLGTKQYFNNASLKPFVKVKDREKIGTYLLTKKDMEAARGSFKNRYYAVYRMTVKSKKKKGKKGYFKTQTFYQPIELIDLYLCKDGGVRDFKNARLPAAQNTIFGVSKILFNGISPMYGYTSLKKMKKEIVTDRENEYNCETEGDLP